MVRVEPDVDRGHPGVVGRSLGALAGGLLLLEQVRVPPVAERDLRVRRRGHGLTENGEVGDRGALGRRRSPCPARVAAARETTASAVTRRRTGTPWSGPHPHRRSIRSPLTEVRPAVWPPARPSRRPDRRTHHRRSRSTAAWRAGLASHRDLPGHLDLDAVFGGARRAAASRPAGPGRPATDDHRGDDNRQDEPDRAPTGPPHAQYGKGCGGRRPGQLASRRAMRAGPAVSTQQRAEQHAGARPRKRFGEESARDHATDTGEPERERRRSSGRCRTAPAATSPTATVGRIASSEVALCLMLLEAERERERGHEQDPAADPEQAGQDAGGETQGDRDRRVRRVMARSAHQTNSRIPTPKQQRRERERERPGLARRC